MRIKRVECDQFAGITGKEIEFDNGLNILLGENESGKSTMVDLIFQLLFKDVKLDKRSETDFIDRYFPQKVSGNQGDTIDGTIIFETSNGKYKLKKEWKKGSGTDSGNCKLIDPKGNVISSYEKVREILADELKHRAGVYSEIVFASQKRDQTAIESIMKALGKKDSALQSTRTDLTSTLNRAVMETGGVSLDKIEKGIKDNIAALISRWDVSADAPEGGPGKASYKFKWSNNVGIIAKAYYEADEVRDKQKEAENAERDVENERASIRDLQAKRKETEDERTIFQKYRGILGQISLLKDAISKLDNAIKEKDAVLSKWPVSIRDIARAKELQEKLKHARNHELYLRAEQANREYLQKLNELGGMTEVDPADLRSLRESLHGKRTEESKLAGMNLAARIKQLGSAEISVTSAVTGQPIDIGNGDILITEAVNISIPGIMEMQLMPQGVDVENVQQALKTFDAQINAIYEKYGVDSPEKLQNLSDTYTDVKQEVQRLKLILDKALGENSWEAVKAANDLVPAGIESENEINRQITELCGRKSVDAFIGGLETTINDYTGKYESVEKLKASIEEQRNEKEKKQSMLDSMDEIPEKFRGIDDPEKYDEAFRKNISSYDEEIKKHNDILTDAVRKLGEKSSEEYAEELLEKEAVLDARKKEYEHWKSIYTAFCGLKEHIDDDPVKDIEAKFREYLKIITAGTLQLEQMDEQMSVKLASGDNALTYDILSDGTKDTVSLAFRLAMLEHIFPGGDGLAVFDDPFADMDAKRVEQSCRLIGKFAENNQVIFVTCDDKYLSLMNGNVISLAK